MSRTSAVLPCLSLLSLFGCELAEVDRPPPPSTEAVQEGFAFPTGTLPESSAEEVAEFLAKASAAYQAFCGYNPVDDSACLADPTCRTCLAVETAADAIGKIVASLGAGDAGVGEGRSIPGIDGVLHVEAICKGWGKKASPDPAHGFVRFTASFTGRGLDPVVWGTFDDCEQKLSGHKLRADGSFTLQWDADAVPLRAYEKIPVEIAFQGKLTDGSDGDTYEADLAIRQRLDGDGPIELYVNDPKRGSFVFSVNSSGIVVARGASGQVQCDVDMDSGCAAEHVP